MVICAPDGIGDPLQRLLRVFDVDRPHPGSTCRGVDNTGRCRPEGTGECPERRRVRAVLRRLDHALVGVKERVRIGDEDQEFLFPATQHEGVAVRAEGVVLPLDATFRGVVEHRPGGSGMVEHEERDLVFAGVETALGEDGLPLLRFQVDGLRRAWSRALGLHRIRQQQPHEQAGRRHERPGEPTRFATHHNSFVEEPSQD